ncbi:MAG: hypothetical protein M1828_000055 [Chrysothrix sp. TS-e1954]|nr:MAG: hypothetical protein M1828_000055 [Chrysothrix sp. TS-e1954]
MGATLPALGIIFVLLRFYNRKSQGLRLGAGDFLILGGLVCVIGMGACLITGAVEKAMGYPTPEPPPTIKTKEQMLQYNPPKTKLIGELQFAFQLLMVVCYGFIKISIVYFYRRIFIVSKRSSFNLVTHIFNVILFLWSVTFVLIVIFPCGRHVDVSWGPPDQQELWCQKIGHTSEEGLTTSDFILDIFLLLLPLPLIWKLHMSITRRLQVTGIIILGLSAIAASAVRLSIYYEVTEANIAGEEIDNNQAITLTMWWSMLESGLALIAACLPSLSNIFTTFTLEKMIRNVRRTLSLQSLRESWRVSGASSRSKGSRTSGPQPRGISDLEKGSPGSSRSALTEQPSTIGRPSTVGQTR